MKRQLTVLAMVAAAAVLAATGAAAAGTSQIDGVSRLVDLGDPFDPTDDVFSMAGYGDGRPALVGSWYTRTFVPGVFTASGVLTATGTEEFVGCFDVDGNGSCGGAEPWGTLAFTYQLSTKYDLVTFAQIHGRCHHPITGGTGDFAGATGVLRFKDDPETGCSYYTGHLTLGG